MKKTSYQKRLEEIKALEDKVAELESMICITLQRNEYTGKFYTKLSYKSLLTLSRFEKETSHLIKIGEGNSIYNSFLDLIKKINS